MKPVSPQNALAICVNDDKPLMMLNFGLLGIRYVMQLIASTHTNVTSIGGTALSPELWKIILEFSLDDAQDSFYFVQGISWRETRSPMTGILRWRIIDFEEDTCPTFGDFHNGDEVDDFEEFLKRPARYTAPTFRPYGDAIDILITSTDDNFPVCLFSDITVPDVISRREGGACSFCNSSRFLCPGCCGGSLKEFNIFRTCCSRDIACPVCMGFYFSLQHEGLLWGLDEKRFRAGDGGDSSDNDIDEGDWLQQRLQELGY